MMWPTLGSRTAEEQNRTEQAALVVMEFSHSNPIKSNFTCSKHITFKCSKWEKQLISRANNKAQKSTYITYIHTYPIAFVTIAELLVGLVIQWRI